MTSATLRTGSATQNEATRTATIYSQPCFTLCCSGYVRLFSIISELSQLLLVQSTGHKVSWVDPEQSTTTHYSADSREECQIEQRAPRNGRTMRESASCRAAKVGEVKSITCRRFLMVQRLIIDVSAQGSATEAEIQTRLRWVDRFENSSLLFGSASRYSSSSQHQLVR